jgi:hypothetical protein
MIIDISSPITNAAAAGEPIPYHIDFVSPEQAFAQLPQYGIPQECFPDGRAWAMEFLEHFSLHGRTHTEYTMHYGGVGGLPINDAPREWFHNRPYVMVDFRGWPSDCPIRKRDLQDALIKLDYRLHAGDTLILHTGAWRFAHTPEFWNLHAGLDIGAAQWAIEDEGVINLATDGWTPDMSFQIAIGKIRRGEMHPDEFWEVHKLGRTVPYCQTEQLFHLDRIPSVGKHLYCMPLSIPGASAAPTPAYVEV